MPPDIELQPGQTAIVKIHANHEYRITHTGWALDIKSTQPMNVNPKSETSVGIGSSGIAEDFEC